LLPTNIRLNFDHIRPPDIMAILMLAQLKGV